MSDLDLLERAHARFSDGLYSHKHLLDGVERYLDRGDDYDPSPTFRHQTLRGLHAAATSLRGERDQLAKIAGRNLVKVENLNDLEIGEIVYVARQGTALLERSEWLGSGRSIHTGSGSVAVGDVRSLESGMRSSFNPEFWSVYRDAESVQNKSDLARLEFEAICRDEPHEFSFEWSPLRGARGSCSCGRWATAWWGFLVPRGSTWREFSDRWEDVHVFQIKSKILGEAE